MTTIEQSKPVNRGGVGRGGTLRACHTCGLVHRVPTLAKGEVARCVRCGDVVRHGTHPRMASRVAAVALAALAVYPLAMFLPVATVRQLGHEHTSNIWDGVIALLNEGEVAVGLVILLASVIAPIGKLVALLSLCLGERAIPRAGHAPAYRVVEFLGRWGMIDVMLIAMLIAAVKLGDLVRITPGPGVIAFAAVVVLNLIASAMFDPAAIWERDPGVVVRKGRADRTEGREENR